MALINPDGDDTVKADSNETRRKYRWLPSPLAGVAAVLSGMLIGMGGFTIAYSDAVSYLGGDPVTCANCHAMNDHYKDWSKGSHARVATCNDCHLPHDDVVGKYLVKAEDGVLHSMKFTLGNYPENIVIRESSLRVANRACLACHGDITTQMRSVAGGDVSCIRCHSGVGH